MGRVLPFPPMETVRNGSRPLAQLGIAADVLPKVFDAFTPGER